MSPLPPLGNQHRLNDLLNISEIICDGLKTNSQVSCLMSSLLFHQIRHQPELLWLFGLQKWLSFKLTQVRLLNYKTKIYITIVTPYMMLTKPIGIIILQSIHISSYVVILGLVLCQLHLSKTGKNNYSYVVPSKWQNMCIQITHLLCNPETSSKADNILCL